MLVIMDLYSVNLSSFPPELNDILLPNQWDYIVYAVNEATKEGHGWACIAEAICCVVFCFPCIFLCHPCFAEPLRLMRIDDRLNEVNSSLFDTQRAVYRQGTNLIVNTDNINMSLQQAYAQNVVYSTGSNASGTYAAPSQVVIIDHNNNHNNTTTNPVIGIGQNNSQTGQNIPIVTATIVK